MSGIFISYSRRDSAQALDLQQRLHREGFRSVFLDTDPEQGIAAGDEWERRLYAKLRSCRALIALSSAAFAESKWCFAEVTHAKALGKSVFPLLVDSSNAHELIRDKQTIDIGPQATDVNAAYQRLFRGLHEAGIVKGGWDARRPPYPGLAAFEAEDAPVFFGRESAVEEALSRLERLHRYQTVAWFLLLGASGSGKSSLLRAGVIPRLSSPSPQWIVVGPMIPGAEPLQQCAREFSKTFASLGVTRDWKELRDVLERGDPRELSELAGDLRDAAKSEAKILLAIDQLEELLPFEREEGFQEGERELLLKRLLQLTSLEARAFLVVGTLRADFLGLFQDQSALRELPADKLVVDPIARQDLRAVIEGPAQLASLSFDEGLVDQIIQETETTDALPLLAFALRELYERYGSDGRLEVREYRELGGLENAVSQAAEAVLKHRRLVHGGGVEVPLPEAESAALRRAFLALVRLGDQDQPVRQPARWASLPDEAKPVLEEFVKARLLIFTGEGERELRVAHEALFRRWAVLVAWIEGARELLRWRHRTAPLIEVWERANRDPGSLLRGAALSEAMLIQQREDQLLLPAERAFVEAGQAQQKAERERAQRTARRTAVAALGVALVLGVLGVFAWGQRGEAQARANEAVINASKAETNARRAGLAARVAEAQARNNSTYAAATLREVGGTVPSDLESQALVALAHVVTNVVLEGHEQSVTSAVFSHDGKNILTASRDGTARVWNADGSGQAIILDRGVGSAAFSPDGKKVLTLSDSTIHIWNADGSSQPIVISGHEAAIISAAFSTDGKKVATTSWDNTVRVWDADGSGEGVILTKEESRSHAPVFSPDGKKVLTSLEDNTARIWNVDGSGQPVILRGHEGTIYSAVFSPDGQSVLTASVDKTARVWNADGSGQANILRGHEGYIYSAVFSPTGEKVLTASQDTTARIWNADGSGEAVVLRGHEGELSAAAFSPDGNRVLTASGDKTARVWNADGSGQANILRGHESSIGSAVYNKFGTKILTASYDGTARVWNADGSGQPLVLRGHENAVPSAVYSPDGKKVLTASVDQTARVWNADGSGEAVVLRGHEGNVYSGVFSPDGKKVLTRTQDNTIAVVQDNTVARVWNADGSGQPIVLEGHENNVNSAVFSPNGERVLTASADKTVRIWNADGSGQAVVLRGHEASVESAVFSPDGKKVLTASADKTVRIWNADSSGQAVVLKGHEASVKLAVFSSDGKKILTASDDKTARVWNADGSGEPVVLRGHEDSIATAVFSKDGKKVLTASADKTARIWNADGSGEVVVLRGHGGSVDSAVFSPDGTKVLTASWDTTARVWEPDWRTPLWRTTNYCPSAELRRGRWGQTDQEAAASFATCRSTVAQCSPEAPVEQCRKAVEKAYGSIQGLAISGGNQQGRVAGR